MNITRDKDGKVTLIDTVNGKPHRVPAPTAREILRNKNSSRYVLKAKYEAMQSEKAMDTKVTTAVAKQEGTVLKKEGDEVSQDILDAHNAIHAEKVQDDERLTQTGMVKAKVLSEKLGREVTQKEHSAYGRHLRSIEEE